MRIIFEYKLLYARGLVNSRWPGQQHQRVTILYSWWVKCIIYIHKRKSLPIDWRRRRRWYNAIDYYCRYLLFYRRYTCSYSIALLYTAGEIYWDLHFPRWLYSYSGSHIILWYDRECYFCNHVPGKHAALFVYRHSSLWQYIYIIFILYTIYLPMKISLYFVPGPRVAYVFSSPNTQDYD